MRSRTALAVPAVLAAAALLPSAQQSRAAVPDRPARCAERALTVRAGATDDPSVVRVSVTNRGARACVVDRVPTVTFGDLDGAALPVPPGGRGTYPLGRGATAHAAVRMIADPADPQARRAQGIAVAPSAFQYGRSFTAAYLGAGDAVLVWEPVTTWWQPTAAAADRALGVS